MARLRLFDYPPSGNCLKARILLAHLELAYERVGVDIFGGDTLTDAFAAINPARLTPVLEVDGAVLPESIAILWYLGEGSPYLPPDSFERGSIIRWLLFEQERVGEIAALRFRLQVGLLAHDAPAVGRMRAASIRALELLETHLEERTFLVADRYSIADIANYCYVHLAPEVGIDLDGYRAVQAWLDRIAAQPGFINDLVPMPADARVGRGRSIYG